MSVMIVTSLGDIVIDLYADKCPLTSKNFLKLCKIKYYNGCLFHTVQKDFTAQTGDPTGTGTAGDSVYKFLYGDQARFFSDEINIDLKHSKTGTIAMASAGENLNASQFYITLRDDLDYLDGKHTVFGEVAEGFETLTRINEAYVDENGRPYKNIRIKHTYILDDPFDDPSQLTELIPDASPEGKPKDEVEDDVRLEDDWVPMDEQLDPSELVEVIRAKEAHSRAVVLESIGDIPDAEIKPPENVLFVCKLNPVTEDEDLHTIFSRFGTVLSAEVIRDFKTGDSLCYAFIEFEDQKSCEQAYFKMDNALIDDRRIHVDFSQSVAKLWSQYRRNGQKGKGGGCFKCGSPDHIAKDCTADPMMKTQLTKFMLKDTNAQHGGDNKSYEMVFEDNSESPRGEMKRRGHDKQSSKDQEFVGSNNRDRHGDNKSYEMVFEDNSESPRGEMKRRGHDKQSSKDQEFVGSNNRDRHGDRNRGQEEHRAIRSDRSSRDMDSHAERKDREKNVGRHRDDDRRWKDELESRKRRTDDEYLERRDSGDYRRKPDSSRTERRDDGERRKKTSAIDDGHRDRKDEREYRKRHEDSSRQRDESRRRKRSPDEDEYRHRREHRRRDTEFNDDRHRR
ncbi:hypothetical protein L6164_022857 [Bauhinia variegata]|uniref:Uncharacterized protein n=1 Tax=Bauhinia variegata TaxID=167791 RepID=A0ACB9MHD5_BAUVA|nr:hypothetical protein L6164_022857 [Bauhinia variegata]